jgi:DNA invertase Pin-like site-specific DNA recombinase/Zn ribbon nucleic-acid-binding protein
MRTALYARVSTGSEEQEQALQQQLSRLRQAAGDHPTTEYIDIASGSRDDRPQLQAMLKACRSGQLDRVIVTRLDRMSRSASHGAQLLTYFSAPDTPSLLALDDSLDLATIGGRLVARMLINLAQSETERLSERIIHGKQHQRNQGKPFGPYPPYGYRWNADRSNYELDPEKAPLARAIVEHFLQTQRLRETLAFARKQLRCPWRSTAGLSTWLMNPSLIGSRCYGKTELVRDEQGQLKRRSRPFGTYAQVIPDCHEPLITQQQHLEIRAVFSDNANRKRAGLRTKRVRELTGLVKCGHCQHTMSYAFWRKGAVPVLQCTHAGCSWGRRNRIKAEVVSAAVWQMLQANWQVLEMVETGHAARAGKRCSEVDRLLATIRQLQELNDPDLSEVIQRKLKRLEVLMQDVTKRELPWDMGELRQALTDERFWEVARSDTAVTRQLFTDLVEQVVIKEKGVGGVQLRVGGDGAAAP